jgi:DNA-binding response OmpR family regulator
MARPGGGEQLPLTVLCLDNDETILDGMKALLGRWGVDCRIARDVDAALQILSSTAVDLILADYHLGDGTNGLDALQLIAERTVPMPPAAMITADGSTELKRRARALGYPLLHKPVRPAALRAMLVALAKRATTTVGT